MKHAMPKQFYMAATVYGGCEHKHRTADTAQACCVRLNRRGLKLRVWRVWYENGKRKWEKVRAHA